MLPRQNTRCIHHILTNDVAAPDAPADAPPDVVADAPADSAPLVDPSPPEDAAPPAAQPEPPVNDLRVARDALLAAYRHLLTRITTTDPRATEEIATLSKAVASLIDNDFAERLVFGRSAD